MHSQTHNYTHSGTHVCTHALMDTHTHTHTAGTDYIAIVSEAVELTPSSTSSTVSVTIQDDSETEPEETFQTFIVTNDNRVMINPNETSVVIIDNDSE